MSSEVQVSRCQWRNDYWSSQLMSVTTSWSELIPAYDLWTIWLSMSVMRTHDTLAIEIFTLQTCGKNWSDVRNISGISYKNCLLKKCIITTGRCVVPCRSCRQIFRCVNISICHLVTLLLSHYVTLPLSHNVTHKICVPEIRTIDSIGLVHWIWAV